MQSLTKKNEKIPWVSLFIIIHSSYRFEEVYLKSALKNMKKLRKSYLAWWREAYRNNRGVIAQSVFKTTKPEEFVAGMIMTAIVFTSKNLTRYPRILYRC